MELTSGVIVYFAFGVPFGILSAYLRTSRFEPIDTLRVIYHLTFWPLIMVVRAFSKFRIARQPVSIEKADHDRNFDRKLRTQAAILEGLNKAYRDAVSATDLRLPFEETIHHPVPSLAAKCFHRRNIRRLERYVLNAQLEYSKILAELNSDRENNFSVTRVDEPKQTIRELC